MGNVLSLLLPQALSTLGSSNNRARRLASRPVDAAHSARKVPKPLFWADLPADIRLRILEAVTQQRHRGWTSAAAVSTEWQDVIEKENFRRLYLRRESLRFLEARMKFNDRPGQATTRIRAARMETLVRHVEYIHLDIELPRYNCDQCASDLELRDQGIIGSTLLILLGVLRTWESRRQGKELTLELSVCSPSDVEHHFKNFFFKPTTTHMQTDQRVRPRQRPGIDHGWIKGRQIVPPPRSAVLRLYTRVESCDGLGVLGGGVGVVTGLNLGRNIRRFFQPASFQLWQLFGCFPRLTTLNYEPWRPWEEDKMWAADHIFGIMMINSLSKNLKNLTIFEDFNQNLDDIIVGPTDVVNVYRRISRRTTDELPKKLSRYLSNLEHLSVAYMINAEDFFIAKTSSETDHQPWLRTLALTSQLLRKESLADPDKLTMIDQLLYDAALAARRMRCLRTLVVWYGMEGEACAFIYQREKGTRRSCITWRGTWELELSQRVRKAWKQTADIITGEVWDWEATLRFEYQHLEGRIGNHGDAIALLDLPVEVVSPGSLWQIRKEHEGIPWSHKHEGDILEVEPPDSEID
ncbi:hypothetical protein V8F20_009060 [Naviculisporaceae sp. PSN 640]